jgi:hypothetical protein
MKRCLGSIVLCLCWVALCYSQDAQQINQDASKGTKVSFSVTLEKGLDSRKLKAGDPVTCLTAGTLHGRNGLLIPSGSRVLGHVTQAQARAKGDAISTLGIEFDKIQVKGKELAMVGTLQAIAPGLSNSGPNVGPAESGSLSGGGRGDQGYSAGTTAGPTAPIQVSGPSGDTRPVNTASTGVLGIKNLEMDANGLITSPGKQVRLDNGTQMVVRAEIQMPVQ